MAKKSVALSLPIFVLIVAVLALSVSGNLFAAPVCPPQGVTLSVTPPAVGEGQGFAVSGHTYPQSGTCSQVGATVYFQYIDPTTGAAQSPSVASDPNNGNYNYQWFAPADYLGTLQVQASLCSFTSSGRSQCSTNGYHDAFGSISVVSNPPPTYNLAFYFQFNGAGISGVAATLIQNGNFIQTQTSNSNGEVYFQLVPPGSGYTVAYQPNGFNNGNYGPFTVSGDMSTNIPLTVVCGGTTTTTQYATTTIYNQVYCSTATAHSTQTITSMTSTSISSTSTGGTGSTSVGTGAHNDFVIALPSSGVFWVNFGSSGPGVKLWILDSNQYGEFVNTCSAILSGACSAPGGDLLGTPSTKGGNFSIGIPSAGTYYYVFDASACGLSCGFNQNIVYQYGFSSSASCGFLCGGGTIFGLSTIEIVAIAAVLIIAVGLASRRR